MNLQSRGFLFMLALSAAVAMPAFGQMVSPVAGGTEVAASIPDFSGMWVHPYFPGIEPPASGPGPVFNRSRRPNGAGNNSPICRRLHQSDPEARGCGNREKAWRNLVVGHDLSDAEQPVLALGSALHFLPARHGDAATAAPDRFPVPAQS